MKLLPLYLFFSLQLFVVWPSFLIVYSSGRLEEAVVARKAEFQRRKKKEFASILFSFFFFYFFFFSRNIIYDDCKISKQIFFLGLKSGSNSGISA